jgi:hypothetical protein
LIAAEIDAIVRGQRDVRSVNADASCASSRTPNFRRCWRCWSLGWSTTIPQPGSLDRSGGKHLPGTLWSPNVSSHHVHPESPDLRAAACDWALLTAYAPTPSPPSVMTGSPPRICVRSCLMRRSSGPEPGGRGGWRPARIRPASPQGARKGA